jgi:hypothetical protein
MPDFSICAVTALNAISCPAPGATGTTTVMGLVGCQAKARVDILINAVANVCLIHFEVISIFNILTISFDKLYISNKKNFSFFKIFYFLQIIYQK